MRTPRRRWWNLVQRGLVAAGLLCGLLAGLSPSADAQIYDRRARVAPPPPGFFNPFSIFTPMFRPLQQPREYRDYREYYEPRERRESREPRTPSTVRPQRAPAVVVDSAKAPPPHKSDTIPAQSVVVIGASLADWLAYGLEEALADRPEIGIVRKIRMDSGLIRYDSRSNTDWAQAIRDIYKEQRVDLVVMLIGLEDRQSMRAKAADASGGQKRAGAALEFRTDEWAAAYAERIDETITALKSKGVPVIWVGLPAVRGTRSTSDMIYLNDLYRARAERAGIVYVDVWDGFVDDGGHFANYGPDVEGQVRRLRTPDGVHFTKAGARKLAHYVEREINHLIGSKLPQVATQTPGDAGAPAAPSSAVHGAVPERPLAGPVVPLTGAAAADALAGTNARAGSADPLVRRVLLNGDTVVGPSGRADNFFVTPEAAAAAAKAATASAKAQTAPAPAAAANAPIGPDKAARDSAPSAPANRGARPRGAE